MSGGEGECPLCMEQMDETDVAFNPCECGYKVCMFCYNKIKEQDTDTGRCPACRRQYLEIPQSNLSAEFQEMKKKKSKERERKEKDRERDREKEDRKERERLKSREHLENVRVIQKNLVYVSNLPTKHCNEVSMKQMFSPFGKVTRVLLNKTKEATGSAYLTFTREDDARNAIIAKDNSTLDGVTLRVMLGLTKYCTLFLNGAVCRTKDCLYRHDWAEEDCTFTLQEVREGKHYVRFGTKVLIQMSEAAAGKADPVAKKEPTPAVKPDGIPTASASSLPAIITSSAFPPLSASSASTSSHISTSASAAAALPSPFANNPTGSMAAKITGAKQTQAPQSQTQTPQTQPQPQPQPQTANPTPPQVPVALPTASHGKPLSTVTKPPSQAGEASTAQAKPRPPPQQQYFGLEFASAEEWAKPVSLLYDPVEFEVFQSPAIDSNLTDYLKDLVAQLLDVDFPEETPSPFDPQRSPSPLSQLSQVLYSQSLPLSHPAKPQFSEQVNHEPVYLPQPQPQHHIHPPESLPVSSPLQSPPSQFVSPPQESKSDVVWMRGLGAAMGVESTRGRGRGLASSTSPPPAPGGPLGRGRGRPIQPSYPAPGGMYQDGYFPDAAQYEDAPPLADDLINKFLVLSGPAEPFHQQPQVSQPQEYPGVPHTYIQALPPSDNLSSDSDDFSDDDDFSERSPSVTTDFSRFDAQLAKMSEMHNVPSTFEKFKSFVMNSFGIKTPQDASEMWQCWQQYQEDAKATPLPPTDPKECNKCGKRFMTAAIAEIHRVKCNAGQLNTAHHMPLRTPKQGGSNSPLILSGEKKDMKDLYKTLISDASKVPQDFGKFKTYAVGTLKAQLDDVLLQKVYTKFLAYQKGKKPTRPVKSTKPSAPSTTGFGSSSIRSQPSSPYHSQSSMIPSSPYPRSVPSSPSLPQWILQAKGTPK